MTAPLEKGDIAEAAVGPTAASKSPSQVSLSHLLTTALVAILTAVLVYQGISEARRARLVKTGTEAPPVYGSVLGGGRFDFDSVRGKAVMVDFWASWCPPCREEMPLLVRLAREYERRGLLLVAANQIGSDNLPAVQSFLNRVAADPPPNMIPLLAENRTLDAYGVHNLPTLYFISRDGKIRDSYVGLTSETTLREAIERALAER